MIGLTDDRAYYLRCCAAYDPVRDAAPAGKQDKCCDHRLDPEHGYQHTVKRGKQNGDNTADQNAQKDSPDIDTCETLEDLYKNTACNGPHGAYADILTAGSRCHYRHSHGDYRKLACTVDDTDNVAGQNFVSAVVYRDADSIKTGISEQVEQDQDRQCNQRDQQLAKPVISAR